MRTMVNPESESTASCPFEDARRVFEDLAAARGSRGLPRSDRLDATVISRYDDIVTALHDPATFSSSVTVPRLPAEWRERFAGRVPEGGTLLAHDNPDHDRLRRAVNTFFVPRRLARYEPWIREQAHQLVDRFAQDGEAELKSAFGLPLALRVIAHVVGLDAERSEWIGESLAFFQGDRGPNDPATRDEKADRLIELHDHIRGVMEDRRHDRKDDLISHIWSERDAGHEMTDFEMLSMFPGLLLAGHETSSNLICMSLSHLLADRSRWDWAQRDDDSRARALEELIRFESAITGMPRLVTRDTELGGVQLRAGERVFLAYASGSRDGSKFAHPDELDFHRSGAVAHLGFGQGIHACLGAPLARILLRTELAVLHERLPNLDLATPYEDRQYTPVAEGRGMPGLNLRWTPQPIRRIRPNPARGSHPAAGEFANYTVTAVERVASDVVEIRLQSGRAPARWRAGAHIDLRLPNGMVRQYSLCRGLEDGEIRIAVLREHDSRGSSAYIHESLRPGTVVGVGAPRNNFPMVRAEFSLFIAGGIGITPLLEMIEDTEGAGGAWRLLYLGRSIDRMAYAQSLRERFGSKVYLWPSQERGRFDVSAVWDLLPTTDSRVYACGPDVLLRAIEESAVTADRVDSLSMERFTPRDVDTRPATAFEVEIASTGSVLRVPADRSILEVVNENGADVLSTCREGTCGTCEVRVLRGVPEHRDSVLDVRERLSNETMMLCVSRCVGDSLTLDL